jgi:hypothetical protein
VHPALNEKYIASESLVQPWDYAFRFRKHFPEGIPSGLSAAFFVPKESGDKSFFQINPIKIPD